MKILMCNKFNFIKGGAERYLFDLKDGLRKMGHTLIDFSVSSDRNEYSEYSAYFAQAKDYSSASIRDFIPNLQASLDFVYSFDAGRKISSLIDKCQPDIAHIHNIYHQISSSILHALRRKKVPVVMTLHDYKLICPNYSLFSKGKPCERCKGGRYYNALTRKCLRNSFGASLLACLEMYMTKALRIYEDSVDLFIAPSRFIMDKAIEFGVDERKLRYLPYAIGLEQFNRVGKNGEYILYFGDVSEKKGVALLLQCAREIGDVPIKIAGDGPDKDKYRNYCLAQGLKNVEFLGYMSRPDLAAAIRNALFVVVPSLWPEVCGLTIYESFACAKCVIAADIGGIPEFIEDKVTGLLFRPADQRDLLEKMRYLLHSPEERERLGDNACRKISGFNDRNKHYQELTRIYEDCLR
ncbi:MAG: glycosyltransferase [Candidatus Omnitrophica bacterium]|jgi:glycosyltransferase involved in cell wall biosynthesis|nr:glycosyltransferase [Candidatus Omnitrophota bacterium]